MSVAGPLRIPLSQLARGARAVVETDQLGADESAMLCAMGLREGCEVTICRSGYNCIVQGESTRLGISRRGAQRILAVPCDCATADEPEGSG